MTISGRHCRYHLLPQDWDRSPFLLEACDWYWARDFPLASLHWWTYLSYSSTLALIVIDYQWFSFSIQLLPLYYLCSNQLTTKKSTHPIPPVWHSRVSISYNKGLFCFLLFLYAIATLLITYLLFFPVCYIDRTINRVIKKVLLLLERTSAGSPVLRTPLAFWIFSLRQNGSKICLRSSILSRFLFRCLKT